ncbi:MAG: glycosyltransferase [Micropepsaceae bacterium]
MTPPPARVLLYSHDSFGLGHLRRCRALGGALTAARPDLTTLIISGSPIIGAFEFPERVDFVRVPGVIKLRDGAYTPTKLTVETADAFRLRAEIIEETARVFRPDLLIVDKEPLGLRGELTQTLRAAKDAGTRIVLGLRDVLDDAEALDQEWARKNVGPALADLYDEIWIYGVRDIFDPLAGLTLPPGLDARTRYTGYLRRDTAAIGRGQPRTPLPDTPYVLVTTGGGGDGEGLIDWALAAYEHFGDDLPPAVFVLGPFMDPAHQEGFLARAAALPEVSATVFDAEMERIVERAGGVIAMGGYNTFCEILSFDKPAVIVPREKPRREQWIRAARAQELGLARMLEDPAEQGGTRDIAVMAETIKGVMRQPRPSAALKPGMMDGLDEMVRLAGLWLAQ